MSELSGGVSASVILTERHGRRVVVKRPLERFKVADDWIVPRERVFAEAEALELVGRLAPGSVPRVLELDRASFTLVMEAAPEAWQPWKGLLLEGEADPGVASRLGQLLAVVHSVDAEIGSAESFEAQRIDPYLRTIQRRHPRLADEVQAYIDRLEATRQCLVHGDYSPKNVLVGESGLWVIDWEVVHRGDPAFDLAFLLNHLALKSIHRPEAAGGYRACSEAFVSAYGDVPDLRYVLGLVGCLMLARVDGKSAAE